MCPYQASRFYFSTRNWSSLPKEDNKGLLKRKVCSVIFKSTILWNDITKKFTNCHSKPSTFRIIRNNAYNANNWEKRVRKKKKTNQNQPLTLFLFTFSAFYFLIREGIRFMQNGTPPPPPFLSNVHVLRPSEPEKMVFTNVSVCLCVCRFLVC